MAGAAVPGGVEAAAVKKVVSVIGGPPQAPPGVKTPRCKNEPLRGRRGALVVKKT